MFIPTIDPKPEEIAEPVAPEEENLPPQVTYLSCTPPEDPHAREVFEKLSPREQLIFAACLSILLEEGIPKDKAERDAAAALLAEQRKVSPTLTQEEVKNALEIAAKLESEGVPASRADKVAFRRVIDQRKAPKRAK